MNRVLYTLLGALVLCMVIPGTLYAEKSTSGIASKKRKELGNGNYQITTIYKNGYSSVITYGKCISCRGTGKCSQCGGTGKLMYGTCFFGSSGICNVCQGKGECFYSSTYYDPKGNVIDKSRIDEGVDYSKPSTGSYDENGRFSDRKYNEKKRKQCRYCGGTKIDKTASAVRPSSSVGIKKYNPAGEKCNICGSYKKHWHARCVNCP